MAGPASQENGVRKAGARERERQMKRIARALFRPREKNPYIFNGKPLADLQELTDYLVAFTGKEGLWVASWLEYLGDEETADRIRRQPGDFKKIVAERCRELKKYL
jgi:hypothetical protein